MGVTTSCEQPFFKPSADWSLREKSFKFKRFAEKVRSHMFDLSRIREMPTADMIEKICLEFNFQDRLAWNEERHGHLE